MPIVINMGTVFSTNQISSDNMEMRDTSTNQISADTEMNVTSTNQTSADMEMNDTSTNQKKVVAKQDYTNYTPRG